MSDSLWPHRQQAAKLLCPWNSPGKNTGVGSHSLLNGSQFSSVQSLSGVHLFANPWIAVRQASLSITNSRSSPKLMSIESVMPSSHLILCHPLLLLPPIPPSIRVFSNESTLRMRWLEYWSFSFSIIPSKEIPGLISFRMGSSLFFIGDFPNMRLGLNQIMFWCSYFCLILYIFTLSFHLYIILVSAFRKSLCSHNPK